MRKPLIATAVAAVAGIGLIAGGTALAAADDPTPSPSASPSLGSGEIRVDDDDNSRVSPSSVKISRDQAIQIAKQRIGDPNARFDSELEREHGTLVWDIELDNARGEHEIDVDANTGKIVRYDLDADDRGDDDGRDDRGDDRMDDSGHDDGDDHGGDRDDDDDHSGHGRGGDDDHDDNSGHGSDD